MKSKRISAVLIAGALLGVGAALPVNHVQAKTSGYKIVKHKKVSYLKPFKASDYNGKKRYVKKGKMEFKADEVKLTSNSAGAKKINKGLHAKYTSIWKLYKKEGKGAASSLKNSMFDSQTFKENVFYLVSQKAHVFKSDNYFSVGYDNHIFYGQGNSWGQAVTYSLKTGKKLKFSDVLKGNSSQIKSKINKAQHGWDKSVVKAHKLGDFSFVVKGNKVYPVLEGNFGSTAMYHLYSPVRIEK
ncbi:MULTISPECIES: hypothetical protein [Lactobacillus]|uniref:Deacetylase PdaC domain-containing protein n=1 Tax=Lactobacillus equicursoris TaxID=420645 RepID=A0A844FP93_9LACO|nr:hypothetical protein [Lactobacillus equicursoris]MDD6407429.1 hypothetical protein [Lactobacillus equicursoris]MST80216.1 hypothetical protein [Lactobacillus equicursoris]